MFFFGKFSPQRKLMEINVLYEIKKHQMSLLFVYLGVYFPPMSILFLSQPQQCQTFVFIRLVGSEAKRDRRASDADSPADAAHAPTHRPPNRLPVSLAELNIKPYECLQCGFRSDRKSDTLRHIRVKHASGQAGHAARSLHVLAVRDAADSIEQYESLRLYKKVKSFGGEGRDLDLRWVLFLACSYSSFLFFFFGSCVFGLG